MRLSYSKQTEPFSLMDSTNSDGLDSALVRVSVATDVKLKYLNVEMEMGHFIVNFLFVTWSIILKVYLIWKRIFLTSNLDCW